MSIAEIAKLTIRRNFFIGRLFFGFLFPLPVPDKEENNPNNQDHTTNQFPSSVSSHGTCYDLRPLQCQKPPHATSTAPMKFFAISIESLLGRANDSVEPNTNA